MFIYSVKTSKRQMLSILACVVIVIAILIVVIVWPSGGAARSTYGPVKAADDAGRVAFLTSLGYQVDPTPAEVREIPIPDEFDEVLESYNALQKTAGMDLEPYQGKRLKCWTYTILGDPSGETLQAHLYVYKDKIVAGDVASTALDGFMTALTAAADSAA